MRETNRPAYVKIANKIRQAIVNRKFSPGDSLPTENEMASRFDTSRVTIRRALKVLVDENLIYSHQGKGYFVCKPDFNRYTLFFDLIRPEHTIKLNMVTIVEPDDDIRNLLSLDSTSVVIMIQVVIYDGETPVACENKYLQYIKGFPTLESVLGYADFPELVDKIIESPFNMNFELAINPGIPGEEYAGMLECPEDEPVIVLERTIKNQLNENIGYGIAYLRKDYGPIHAISSYNQTNA